MKLLITQSPPPSRYVLPLRSKHYQLPVFKYGIEVQLYPFLNPATDGGEWPASRLSHFTPRERAPGTHWIWGCALFSTYFINIKDMFTCFWTIPSFS